MPRLKILTFGAGALGTYLGGSLSLAGQQVVFLEQPAVLEPLRRQGLRLDLTIDPRRKAREALALPPSTVVFAGSLEEALRYGPFDTALYALKSFDTPAAVQSLQGFAARLPPVCCFSNGVDNEPALAEVLGPDGVIPATVTTAIGRRAAGDIVVEKLRGIGVATGHPLSQRLLDVANSAFLNARPFVNAAAMKWSKLLTNLIANPTSAILDMTAAEIFANPALYVLEVGMLRECLDVMQAQRIPVVGLPGTPVRALAFAVRLPARISKPFLARAAGSGRGQKMPSFHIDLHSGRGKSEVEYLHGAVVRAGRKFGVPTPINEVLTETLLALTRGKKALADYAHRPGRLLAEFQSPIRLR
jgi:2-dehydropantoate 2-reductase